MKRLLSIVLAGIVFTGFIAVLSYNDSRILKAQLGKIVYYNSDTRNICIDAMSGLLKDNAIAVFGSSELSASDDIAYPAALYNYGNSDFNTILIGRGHQQSLHHAIDVAALDRCIPSRKLVLILSPQWFTQGGISDTAYASTFKERAFSEAIRNPGLSYELKRRLCDRVEVLLSTGDLEQYKRVLRYDKVFVEKEPAPVDALYLHFWDLLMNSKNRNALLKELKEWSINPQPEQVKAGNLDYKALLEKAERQGERECTNNAFYVYDEYYTRYIVESLNSRFGTGGSYSESLEYDDFELFLDVCAELGIQPLIVSMPVNGLWYDWLDFPSERREIYYQRIRTMCQQKGVQMLDFSEKDYEPYFLKDIMHCGWKGWVYMTEAIYRYSQENTTVLEYPFPLTASIIRNHDQCYVRLNNRLSDIQKATLISDASKVDLEHGPDGYLISTTLPLDFSINGPVRLEASGVNGAGCVAQVTMQTEEHFLWKNTYTNGAQCNGSDGFDFVTQMIENSFSYVTFQLYDVETGEFIMNFGESAGRDYVTGAYLHELESGMYRLVFKANSNMSDEYVSSIEYFEKGETYRYAYTVNELTGKRVSTENVHFVHTVAE